jgi:2-keto-4-pentenoate hydratase/2-oxohepta-3-ene-1,7-dioic acid hydratase in catechol pathway
MEPGDVLLTGTPAGVSQVRDGDRIKCDLRVNDRVLSELSVGVQNEPPM